MKTLPLMLLVLVTVTSGCAASSGDTTPERPSDDGKPDACYRSARQYAPATGSCWRVDAAPGSSLAGCEDDMTGPANQTIVDGHLVSFDLKPGQCFYSYDCDGPQPATVYECPQ